MNTMSENITCGKCNDVFNSMSGNIELYSCTGTVNTMSGDITLSDCNCSKVNSMSGDMYITDCDIKLLFNMSGDVMINDSKIDIISTQKSELLIKNSKINRLDCGTKLILRDTYIHELIIHGGYNYSIKSGFKWWNPFTWFSNQTQISGSNSINIQSTSTINIDSDIIKINGVSIDELDKKAKPIKFTVPVGCTIDKIILKTPGIVYAKKPVEVIGGDFAII